MVENSLRKPGSKSTLVGPYRENERDNATAAALFQYWLDLSKARWKTLFYTRSSVSWSSYSVSFSSSVYVGKEKKRQKLPLLLLLLPLSTGRKKKLLTAVTLSGGLVVAADPATAVEAMVGRKATLVGHRRTHIHMDLTY